MTLKICPLCMPVALLFSATLLTSSGLAQSIGINFGSDDAGSTGGLSMLMPSEVAGVVPQANWNNAGTMTGTVTDAVDDSGAATSLDVNWSAEESWSGVGGTPATPNGKLLNGWISENTPGSEPSTVSLSQIPYSQYDLYFYLAHDRGGAGENTVFGETGGAFADFDARENVTGATVAADPFLFDVITFSGGTGNFFVVKGLSQSSLNIEFGSANDRSPFAGFQIVETTNLMAGDVNGDGFVNSADYDIIEANMWQRVATRGEGDLNTDLFVDFKDFREWKANVSASGLTGGVPEPGALCLACLGGLGLLASRSRRLGQSLIASLLMVGLASTAANAQSVGVNFGSDDAGSTGGLSALAATDVAGVVPQANWNNADAATGALSNIVDDSGAATTIDVEWAAEESWSGAGGAPATPSGVLMNGWISENATDELPSTITISQIPYEKYDLIIYMGHDRAEEDTLFTETGGAFTDFLTLENVNGDVLAADPFVFSEIAVSGEVGTHFVTRGLTQTSLGIEFAVAAGQRAPVSGFQIVENLFQLGDVDQDGNVDVNDLNIIRGNFFMTEATPGDGDVNLDRIVDWKDFKLWKQNVTSSGSLAGVPEPSSLLLCGAALLGFGGCRRRRRGASESCLHPFRLRRAAGGGRRACQAASSLVAVVAALICVPAAQAQLVNNTFTPAAVGDWNIDANWLDPNGNMFAPSDEFREVAVINNAASVAQISSTSTPTPAGLNVGPGAVEIMSTGSLSIVEVTDEPGSGVATINGNGRLSVASGGAFNAVNLTVNGTLGMGNTATVGADSSVTFGAASTLALQLNSNSFNPISTSGAITQFGGDVTLDFGFTPAPTDTWEVFDAGSIVGITPTVTVNSGLTLDPWQRYAIRTSAGGNGTVGTLQLEDRVVLSIDRATGVGTITNMSGSAIDLDGYVIESALGSVGVAGFNSFDSQSLDGDAWGEFGVLTANAIGELRQSGVTSLGAGASRSIGTVYDPTVTQLGTDYEDLTFSYSNESLDEIGGVVLFEGNKKFNNLVLNVDPVSGEAVLVNESPLDITIDGYAVRSSSGSLLTGGWSSLEDQGAAGGDWLEILSNSNQLGDLKESGATTLTEGMSFNLGAIFDPGGEQDLTLEFFFSDENANPQFGVVSYESLEAIPGDYNGNGVVDAADYTVFRDNEGASASAFAQGSRNPALSGAVSQADYTWWRTNYGATSAGSSATASAPEPCGLLLAGLAALGVASPRRRVGA